MSNRAESALFLNTLSSHYEGKQKQITKLEPKLI
jgi:hypothetical protein